jgi:hypothetical protein
MAHPKTSPTSRRKTATRIPASISATDAKTPAWSKWSDDELLDMRLCDMKLRVSDTKLHAHVKQLYSELEARELTLRPHVWFSSEWFSPDGIPGIAIPFYLAHPRLRKLEQKLMLQVEGGTRKQCMMILRHETGHAICSAFRLHRRKRWRELFGKASSPYPEFYEPEPFSRDYVVHLDWWYAQSHPMEDFAETFAAWINPRSRWHQVYRGWPALRKLEYVDDLMKELANQTPAVRSRAHIEPLKSMKSTLRQHYQQKRMQYMDEWPDFYDRDLMRIFSNSADHAKHPSATSFLRNSRAQVRELVAEWTGTHPYTVDQVLRDMNDRCKELKLRLSRSEDDARTDLMLMVAVQTMNFLHAGHHRIAL